MHRPATASQKHWRDLLGGALRASLIAGDAVMQVYKTDFTVRRKSDHSPLTEADQRSQKILASQLSGEIPLLSEEGSQTAYGDRKDWSFFWLIDPLDGTKEFIKRNGEFTINVALIERDSPIAGIVYLPAKRDLFLGGRGLGAYRISGSAIERIQGSEPGGTLEMVLGCATPLPDPHPVQTSEKIKIVQSISHVSPQEADFIRRLKTEVDGIEIASAGSSLKFCLVAEGSADLYPRFGPTMEWDTAAGQCIAESAGGEVLDLADASPVRYNKAQLRNNPFIVIGSRIKARTPWRDRALGCAQECVAAAPPQG
jgi:3'(2'), 5'-bisphosphate nucleotidase